MRWRRLTPPEHIPRPTAVPSAGVPSTAVRSAAVPLFEPTVLPHLDAAYNLARWLVHDGVLAEDVVQDAMLRALGYFATYRGGDARAWLLRIVRNTAYSTLATRRRASTTSLNGNGADYASPALQVPDPGDDPEAAGQQGAQLAA